MTAIRRSLNTRHRRRRRKTLTSRQSQILAFIKRYLRRCGYAPSTRDIAEHYSIQSNAVVSHIILIERKGYIRRVPNVARGLVLL